jgi:flavin reductase (NADH)
MLVSVDRSSRTLAALRDTKRFVVNFLKAGAEDVSTRFATKEEDKFRGIPWVPSSVAAGVPILSEAVCAVAECVVTDIVEAGDHVMFIGQVEGGRVLGGAPLMYYRRTYAAWPEEKPAPPAL